MSRDKRREREREFPQISTNYNGSSEGVLEVSPSVFFPTSYYQQCILRKSFFLSILCFRFLCFTSYRFVWICSAEWELRVYLVFVVPLCVKLFLFSLSLLIHVSMSNATNILKYYDTLTYIWMYNLSIQLYTNGCCFFFIFLLFLLSFP